MLVVWRQFNPLLYPLQQNNVRDYSVYLLHWFILCSNRMLNFFKAWCCLTFLLPHLISRPGGLIVLDRFTASYPTSRSSSHLSYALIVHLIASNLISSYLIIYYHNSSLSCSLNFLYRFVPSFIIHFINLEFSLLWC